MKGPYERLKYDLRRVWECPECKRRERTSGAVASRLCMCRMNQAEGQPVVMKLVEDGVQRTVPAVAIPHEEPPASSPIESPSPSEPPASNLETQP